ncbi:hypothetical protein LTR78_005195 [Recurvomyces mirabilis]|uniref:Alpha-galactosidase n=1 Tax=Recurvomyces mirabilis TaxID=574656 RepID=A0AAE0WNB2_9PEZI|nr:hypothetical protein LTR78_005195 [Recurvomyces mirabilis]KAK5157745.1 hypothetical protein LTS14_003667 [Recurvomyces mirabilis]
MSDILPDQQPPDRKPAYYPASSEGVIDARVTCIPSLGQATQIARANGSVRFTVLLETTNPSAIEDELESSDDGPAVCLWHDHQGVTTWSELPLKSSKNHHDILLLNRPTNRQITRYWFTAELPGQPQNGQIVSFTIKFKMSDAQGWKWVKDSTGIDDGALHYHTDVLQKGASLPLHTFFDNPSPDLEVNMERPETDNTLLYSVTCPVAGAQDPDSGYQHHRLGKPSHSSRWFALVRLWSPWLAPRQGKTGAGKFVLDKEGMLLSFLRDDGSHVVCLAISGLEDVVTTFINDGNGDVIIKGRNDRKEVGQARVLVAVADSFEVANAAVFYHARKVVGTYGVPDADAETARLMEDKVKPQWLEEWYDGLTYCTWNGLGQNLTDEKIYHALDSLSKENINITNLIIDDNWQSLSSGDNQFRRGWSDFEANKEGFPNGMKATTTEIRKRHPNVNHIAVWHAILGYWGGIAPDGSIAKNYKTLTVKKEAGVAGGSFTVVAASDAKRMYDDFYRFLSASGIDSVKTDAQFFLDLLLHAPDRREMMTAYQDAWTIAHLRHFSSRAISCMSQTPQILFHSQLPTNKPRLLVRNSDDFFPEIPASHPWHIFCNAHNSLFTQHLNVLPDWDMFQTNHSWAGFHAAARCVSGGPIYFTDEPGKHDIKLIRQMTAQTTKGKSVILRPSVVGKAVGVYDGYESGCLLKVGTYHGAAETGTGMLGVFNVSQEVLSEFVQLEDFMGTEKGRSGVKAMVGVELGVQGWDVLSAHAVRTFTIKGKEVDIALLGLLGKMTGCAAITGQEVHVESNQRLRVWVQLKALGVLGLYISELKGRSVEKDFMVMIFGKPAPVGCVKVSEEVGGGNVLAVDVERAWKEMGLEAGWNNEVSVEVFMS